MHCRAVRMVAHRQIRRIAVVPRDGVVLVINPVRAFVRADLWP
jgi:hypothetical protein